MCFGTSLIVGAGEIGKSLLSVLETKHLTFIIDKNEEVSLEPDIMHICFPYSDRFVEFANEYIDKYKPKVTVIHSTIPMGTTKKLKGVVFHSPVIGKHPDLKGGILTFTKWLSGGTEELAPSVVDYFTKAGVTVGYVGEDARNTEFAKIMCTTYYGWNIIFEKGMKELCDKYGLDFDFVYTEWNKNYNEGYAKLGMAQFVRPILTHTKGKIGGHCVVQNCELEKNLFTKLIKKQNETYA